MTSFTVLKKVQTADPTREIVVLHGDSGYTYTSTKFGTLQGGHVTRGSSTMTAVATLSVSTNVATITANSMKNERIYLELWG